MLDHAEQEYSGLQVVIEDSLHWNQEGLEAVGEPLQHVSKFKPLPDVTNGKRKLFSRSKRRKHCLWMYAILTAVLFIVTIAVAIPIGIKTHNASNDSVPGPPAQSTSQSNLPASKVSSSIASATPTARIPSTVGALNGTSLSVMDAHDASTHNIWLYFQHHSGEIRKCYTTQNGWAGGTSSDVVVAAGDVRNGTPITTLSFWANPGNQNLTYQVIYLDSKNVLHDVFQVNNSGNWTAGTLGQAGFVAAASPNVAFYSCSADSWSQGGQSDFSSHPGGGAKVYFGGADNRVHEISNPYGSDTWTETYVFPASDIQAYAGIFCWVPTKYQYLFGLSADSSSLVQWWRNNDDTQLNSTNNPIDTWVQGNSGFVTPRANASVTFTGFNNLYYQDPNNNIRGVESNVTDNTVSWGTPFSVDDAQGLPGTMIECIVGEGPYISEMEWRVFFQQKGNDIVEYLRDAEGGAWSSGNMPVDDP